jgi:hypothetical protein
VDDDDAAYKAFKEAKDARSACEHIKSGKKK